MFFQQKLYYFSYILRSFSSGKHALRKASYLPSHICPASAVYLRRKLTFTAIFLAQLTDHFDASFNPKTPQRQTLQITLCQLEKRTSSRTTDAV